MVSAETDWRELCHAIANEHNSERLGDLVQKLLDVLDASRNGNSGNDLAKEKSPPLTAMKPSNPR